VLTVPLAWTAVVAAAAGAALFGQTARPPVRRSRRRRTAVRTRIGMAVSMAGPWVALLAGAGAGLATGAWLPAAAGTLAGVVAVAGTGLALAPR
jgi:hypothetical protein